MHIFVTGATGFVGRALVQSLLGQDHEVTAWVRDPQRARQSLGSRVHLCATGSSEAELARHLSGADIVVNLAGESLLSGAWTKARKRAMRESRVHLTQQLMAACQAAARPPRVIISASAVGYYGDSGATILEEPRVAGTGFLPELCADWERAALAARSWGARVALLRIGLVLAADGGLMAAMRPAFSLGLGGPLGSGEQYMPWIHRDDLIAIIVQALSDPRFAGPINCTAPEPVTSRVFARALGAVLQRPAVLRVPAFALRALLGARAQLPLQSQRAVPRALEGWGFSFRYTQLEAALRQCIGRNARVSIRRATAEDRIALRRKPAYVLEQTTRLHVPLEQAFGFFCRAENLGLITPSFMKFELLGEPPAEMQEGTEINYRIGLGPVPMRWKTNIRSWQPPGLFVDTQEKGPYALWWHEHHLHADGESTVMLDRVYYSPPLGILGRLAHGMLVARTLRAIFGYRAEAIARLFGPRALV
jgi:uncharacterized protein (TIGR01777 family)